MFKRTREASADGSKDVSGDDSQSSSILCTRKRRRLANASQLDLCQEIFDALRSYRSEDGSLCETFMRLPSKRSNAEYYEAVKELMDLARVQAKIKSSEYESIDDMAADINLIVANTKAFYPASTTEFAKAVELQEVFDKERYRVQALVAASSASTASSASSKTAHNRIRRRRRPKREEPDDDEVESASIAASEDSHIAPSETSTTNLTTSSQRSSGAFESPYEMLFAAIAKFIDEDGRSLAHTFTYLPSREEYPVYYAVIEEPIDLRMIARRIQSGRYSSLDELEKDFMLMSRNAKTFNEPKSLIYQDATTLARILKGKRSEAEHPPLRTNKERGKRASRLNYDPHEVVMHYATLTEGPSAYQLIKQNESEADLGSSVAGEEDDTRATGNTSQSCSSVSSSPGKRKRGRPPKHHPQPTMTTSQDGSRESIPVESSSPLITAAVGTSPTSAPADVRQSFGDASSVGSNSVSGNSSSVSRYRVGTVRWRVSQVLQAVLDARNESGHLLCTPFMRLPSRKIYPDYYQEIANPMSLADIKKKLKLNSYTSLNSLMNDLDLVFKNAQQYNVEESAIYRDSLILQQIMRQRYQEMLAYDAFSSKRIHSPALSTAIVTTASTSDPSIGSFAHHDATPQKRPGKRLMTAEEAKTKRLHNLFNTVINYVAEDGHRPHEVFMHLPSKVDYPEYYKVIPEPIDLTIIRRKMEQNEYRAHQEMVADLRLMFNNARHFNEEGSQVYNDADMLDRAVKRRLKSLGPYQGNWNITNICCAARTDRNSGTPETHPQQVVGTTGDMYRTPANVVAPPNASPSGMQTHLQSSPAIPLLQRVILELFQTVREYQVNGRQLSACFMRLPTRSEMPAYYEFIKKPMELQTIAKQVVQMRYTDFEEFVSDLSLMFDNACRFNEPNSQIYTDALTLHRVSLAKRAMILNTFAGHLGIPPCIPPDFPTGVRRLLTNLHNAMLTACDADGRGLVDSLIAGDGTEATLTSVTAARLAALHRAVAAGAYRRLDRLQSDWLKILKRARIGEGADQPANARNPLPTLQQRLDAADLARRWVRLRDDLCRRQQRRPSTFPLVSSPQGTNVSDSGGALPTHLALLSPAMVYTSAALDRELSEEEAEHKLLLHTDQHGEGIPPPLGSDETVLAEITVRDQSFHVGDFVYVESLHPPGALHRIARILSIRQFTPPAHTSTTPTVNEGDTEKPEAESPPSADTSSHQVIHVHVAWYWRPSEAHPSRRRRLLTSEVFRTALTEVISTGRLVGRCLVMHISQFIRLRAKNMDERDVFICESQFSIKSQTFVKIQNWEIPVPSYVELEQRPMTFVPTRLPPNEPLENALEQVDASLFTDMIYPLPRVYTSIVADDPSESDDIVIHEQYVHQNGFLVKLGDFLYVPTGAALSDKLIVRVDKLWKSNAQDMVYFSGPSFVSPSMVEHLPTRMFYPKEVFLASTEHATYALVSATGKCFVMRPADYCQAFCFEHNLKYMLALYRDLSIHMPQSLDVYQIAVDLYP
ncbi:unnamed protein product [Dicrocoelium dendriticum]|nr:unnamed protein product [Dicrocoelium dendriticum]